MAVFKVLTRRKMNIGVSKVEEQEKDRRMVLREENLKKEKKKRKEKTSRSKEGRKRGIAERSDSENWIGENLYVGESRGIVE